MDYTTYGQPWQQKQVVNNRLPIKAKAMFFYKHHPESWEIIVMKTKKGKQIIEKPYWVPHLHCQRLTPGVNGARMNGKTVDGSLAKARAVDAGFTILDPEKIDYVRVYPAHKGNYHIDKFTKIERIGTRVVETFNHEDFNLFRLELVKNQHIQLPHPLILKEKIIETHKSIDRKANKSHVPEQRKAIDELYKRIDYMKQAMEGLENQGLEYYEK